MAFTPLQKLFPRAARKMGVYQALQAAHVCQLYRRLAPRVVHPEALHYTEPRSLKNGTLSVVVHDSAWAHEIKSHERELLGEFEKLTEKKAVKRIKTIVG